MNVKEIKELVDMVARRGLAGLEVERAGFRLRIEGPRAEPLRNCSHGTIHHAGEIADPVPVAMLSSSQHVAAGTGSAHLQSEASKAVPQEEGLHIVTSPIVGTFYRAPNPNAESFVKTGDVVEKGQTLCIVEAMKLMNEIESDADGAIVEIFPQNGQPVEYGERLFSIRAR